jgi:putative addiction module antidote protein, CC2985 family
MAKRESLSVSLTPHEAAFVAGCIQSGRWQSADEVVRSALKLLEHEEGLTQSKIERARSLIQEGADQLDRGETVSGDDFFKDWDAEMESWRSNT